MVQVAMTEYLDFPAAYGEMVCAGLAKAGSDPGIWTVVLP